MKAGNVPLTGTPRECWPAFHTVPVVPAVLVQCGELLLDEHRELVADVVVEFVVEELLLCWLTTP